jgi:DNA-binding transcriptional regulator YhcF (GntR family)
MAQSATDRPFSFSDLPLSSEEFERSALVDFAVDRDDQVPVGTQLLWRLRGMIARGALREHDRLPSVRELAGFAGVNVNTGRAVYTELESLGLIASEHGRGTFVTERAAELRRAGELAEQALAEARAGGIDPRELAAVLYAAGSTRTDEPLPAPLPTPGQGSPAALRRELRRQISYLERELAEYAWDDRRGPPPDRPAISAPLGHVAGDAELERTRDELIERLSRLRGEAARRGAVEQVARTHVESMVRDPAGHRWEIVSSEQTGDPGCKNWRVVPRFGPVGAIMGWWRVKVSSGCPLAGPLAADRSTRAFG